MGTYIFYTDEGYVKAPNNTELENLQILGIEDGKTQDEALANLYNHNEWIKMNGFSDTRIRCHAVLKSEILEDIKTIVQYLWEEEYKHWEECGCPNEHIFQKLKNIKKNI